MAEKQKRDLEATRVALLDAAKSLMVCCTDSDKVTSRAIAAEAGVNLAMINYCYGSREKLMYEVFRQLLTDAQKATPELAAILSSDLSPCERLVMLHYGMMKLMISNFNYSKAITKYVLLNRNDGMGMESLSLIKEHFSGSKSQTECKLIAFELSSLHELAVLRHDELKELCGIDLTDDETLRNYVRKNVERFLCDNVKFREDT